nr:hypothetical protein [Kibdelosporangium sp. MJ126-NF4]CTQ90290.1 hypothetical protein [Kibdelosporangium sp. MJ126-NF4]
MADHRSSPLLALLADRQAAQARSPEQPGPGWPTPEPYPPPDPEPQPNPFGPMYPDSRQEPFDPR